jgi:hypothetical protein
MKKILVLVTGLILSTHVVTTAQPNIGCNDRAIRLQSEQIKQGMKEQGMTVYRDAMIGMESQQPYPIAVHLEKGKMYQMIYVANNLATKMDFELFDQNDHKLDSRSVNNPAQNNYIIYSFVPEKTDMYMVVLTQKMKKKSLCGSFSILEQANDKK